VTFTTDKRAILARRGQMLAAMRSIPAYFGPCPWADQIPGDPIAEHRKMTNRAVLDARIRANNHHDPKVNEVPDSLGPWDLTSWDEGGRSVDAIARPDDILVVGWWQCAEHGTNVRPCCPSATPGVDEDGRVVHLPMALTNGDTLVDHTLRRVASKLAPKSIKKQRGIRSKSDRSYSAGEGRADGALVFDRPTIQTVDRSVTYSAPSRHVVMIDVETTVRRRRGGEKVAEIEQRRRPHVPSTCEPTTTREARMALGHPPASGRSWAMPTTERAMAMQRTIAGRAIVGPDDDVWSGERVTMTLDPLGYVPVERSRGGRKVENVSIGKLTGAQKTARSRQRARMAGAVWSARFRDLSPAQRTECDLLILASL
jgi:hypothetical protein